MEINRETFSSYWEKAVPRILQVVGDAKQNIEGKFTVEDGKLVRIESSQVKGAQFA